jgi:hypothetical protein
VFGLFELIAPCVLNAGFREDGESSMPRQRLSSATPEKPRSFGLALLDVFMVFGEWDRELKHGNAKNTARRRRN